MSENTTRTSHRRSDDGTLTELKLTLPTVLLERLAQVADQAAEAYRKGGDDEDEVLFGDAVLSPLASLLWRAAQSQ